MMTSEQAIAASISLCLAGAVLTLLVARNKTVAGWVAFVITASSAALICVGVAQVFIKGPGHPAQFLTHASRGVCVAHPCGWTDRGVSAACRVRGGAGGVLFDRAIWITTPDYGVARYYPNFLLFLAAMYGLREHHGHDVVLLHLLADDDAAGLALIRFEHRKPENVRAANKYLIMMQLACAATMGGAELIATIGAEAQRQRCLKV